MTNPDLKTTPLFDLHQSLGGKMVPFAGYAMPVQYTEGVLKEHLHTREAAGLFDVSHMGQAFLDGIDGHDAAKALEKIVPGNITGLKEGGLRYTMLLAEDGGILDDLMVTRVKGHENRLYLVVNAACKDQDFALIEEKLAGLTKLERLEDRALVALQGPQAVLVLKNILPDVENLAFMTADEFDWNGSALFVSRSGYTGEDGFEISVPNDVAEDFAETLLADKRVKPIGLGARDSLRLEAGLCLYGSDLDETTSPVEADLVWAIGKARRESGDFPGSKRILEELDKGPSKKRVGIQPIGRAPARHGTEIVDGEGAVIGEVTSGSFGPSLGGPVAMGYVRTAFSQPGSEVGLVVRGKTMSAKIVTMPFVPHRYVRKQKTSA